MSANRDAHQGSDDFDSVGGSRGSSGTQSPWHRDPSPPKPSRADQHAEAQHEYLAHVGVGADTESADSELADGEAVASTKRRAIEEDKAGPQTESESLRKDEDSAAVNEDNFDMADPDDDAGSRMNVDEQQAGHGEPKARLEPQG